jgi:hypothetical protein
VSVDAEFVDCRNDARSRGTSVGFRRHFAAGEVLYKPGDSASASVRETLVPGRIDVDDFRGATASQVRDTDRVLAAGTGRQRGRTAGRIGSVWSVDVLDFLVAVDVRNFCCTVAVKVSGCSDGVRCIQRW